ncbi:MAG: biopolymer transporter ExbD [Spirochaetota bacterium]|nr:biopolymer transporter ExbD [Spirochaetota bacterium]
MIEIESRLKAKVSMDFTALVDVIFILLIFFIISYNEIKLRGHRVDVPEDVQGAALELQKEGPIVITAYKDGKIFLLNKAVSLNDLPGKIRALANREDKSPDILINAESKTEFQVIISIMDAIKMAGIKKSPYVHTKKKIAK